VTTSQNNPPSGIPTLSLENISKLYAGVPALSNVDLTVLPGEIHALLGENGAGKSTLMNVASGTVQPDGGSIVFAGEAIPALTPAIAARLGIAIVHQHPAVLPDLTVEENLRVALPASVFSPRAEAKAIATRLLDGVGLSVALSDRVENLSMSEKHLLEIAKAFALNPKLLILDEPTAPLGRESVDLLFARVRAAVAQGTSVVYITHRLAEVRELADRVTVLRDGQLRGVLDVDKVTDDDLLSLIIGRKLESTFPSKATPETTGEINLTLTAFTGPGFKDVSVTARRGEILGVAGVSGNGQSEFMKALAGLEPFSGTVDIAGKKMTPKDLLADSGYLPADRHHDGLMMTLSVRENAAISALKKFKRLFLVSEKKEKAAVSASLSELAVKAASPESAVSSLSGGNQQKVVMARALLSEPRILIADEPTQGVDVGARSEIYRILREISASGIPVIVNSSDAMELEGLCDRVIVMSRGHVVDTLEGGALTESNMIRAAVSSTTESVKVVGRTREPRDSGFGRFLRGDYAPSTLLLAVMVVLGVYIFGQNARYISDFNINSMLMLATSLGFIALGQTVALLIGGIDLSVGPLAGLLVVIASFFINDESSGITILVGFLLMLVVAVVVGLVNGSLIRFAKFTAIAATLTLYIGLQGFSFLLRAQPGGYMNQTITDAIKAKIGPIPVAFLVLVILAIGLEFALRKTRWGWQLRATGSNEESARRVGVNVNRTVVFAYMTTSFFAFLGAIMLVAQLGVGDAAQGVGYTLTSITAVVLGGTSLLGGRGNFIGTLLGAILLIQVLNAIVFLGLDEVWQYGFQGLLILAAAILYSFARTRKKGSVIS
jgi:ribose transport system ATP-binding protein